ncbi:hypothetical protein Hanom_Chr10g00927861 [Helianthus anomalus]
MDTDPLFNPIKEKFPLFFLWFSLSPLNPSPNIRERTVNTHKGVGRRRRATSQTADSGGCVESLAVFQTVEKEKGKSVGYLKVFLQTRATKECKKMLKDGEITEKDYDRLKFVTERAKRSYVSSLLSLTYNYFVTFTS